MKRSRKNLHVVSFDVPYPADYGGVIDVFYKLRALQKSGVRIWLHCFSYGRMEQPVLNEFCEKVFYYKRRTFRNPILLKKPYIVATRESELLLNNLLKNNWPILFEGLHTTAFLDHPLLASRFKMVRTHNVEHHYYKHLEAVEKNYFKKYFFRIESEKLKKYQTVLKHAQSILPISQDDAAYFNRRWSNVQLLPPFHANEQISVRPGLGQFVLYHGNLGVGENNEAALYLIQEVFSKINVPFVIAGNKPSNELLKAAALYPHIQVRHGISTEEISQLIEDAQINVLYTSQSTGIKLKLIHALYRGRHVVVNAKMVQGTGLEPLCHVAGNAEQWQSMVAQLFEKPFQPALLGQRQELLRNFQWTHAVKIILDQLNLIEETA